MSDANPPLKTPQTWNVSCDLEPSLPQLGELAAALAKAQAEYKPLKRTREVTVRLQTGGSYKYKYAPLDECFEACRGPLSKHGLAVSQVFHGDSLRITTTLMHLMALVGMAAEEDTDGPPGNSQSYDHSAARPQREGSKTPESGAAPPTKQGALSQAQLKRLFAISKASGWTTDQLKTYLLLEYRIEHSNELSLAQYNELCGDKKKKVKGILEDGPPTDETAEPPTEEADTSSPEDPGTEAGGGYAELAKKILDAQGDSEAMLALAVAVGNSKALSDEDRANLNELISGGKNGDTD
jgi:hypothetical protein